MPEDIKTKNWLNVPTLMYAEEWIREGADIHMQPQTVPLTDVCDLVHRIEGSKHRGSCGGVHKEGDGALNKYR